MLHDYSLPYRRDDFPFSSSIPNSFGRLPEADEQSLLQPQLTTPIIVGETSIKSASKKQIKNYLCPVNSCNEKCSNEQQLQVHLKVHDAGLKPFTCNACDKVCKTQNLLKSHIETHKKDSISPLCGICKRNFSSMSALNKHMKRIHYKKPFKCHFCQSGFESQKYLDMHIKRCPESQNEDNSSSDECINKQSDMWTHKTSDSNSSNFSPLSLTNHSTVPTTQPQTENLYTHTGSSSTVFDGIQSYTCHICSSTFPYSSYLQQHMSVHYSEKQPCHICGMPFPTFRDLANHLRTHTVDEQSKVTLDFSNYGDSSYFSLTSLSMSAHQSPLSSLQYQSQPLSHQFIHYPQQQSSQPLYLPPHCQQNSSTYSHSFQYTMPFYSDKRSSLIKENGMNSLNMSYEVAEKEASVPKYFCPRCRECFLSYITFSKHQERCLGSEMDIKYF